ncbi:MAG: HDIG domain-containing metalloprotein [Planctomycetota bacterium]
MAEKSSKNRNVLLRKGSRPRRTVPRRRVRPLAELAVDMLATPAFGWGLLIGVVFVTVVGVVTAWTREQPLIAAGMVAPETRTVRVQFDAPNAQRTEQERDAARLATPQVLRLSDASIQSITGAVRAMPAQLVAAGNLEDVDRAFRDRTQLTEPRLSALKAAAAEPQAATWSRRVDRLGDVLRRNPLLEPASYVAATQIGRSRQVELVSGENVTTLIPRDQAINLEDQQQKRARLSRLVANAGFEAERAQAVTAWLATYQEPTATLDLALTEERQQAAASQVAEVVDQRSVGQVIFNEGDVVESDRVAMLAQELKETRSFRAETGLGWLTWAERGGAFATVAVLAGVLGGYIATFVTKVAKRPQRVAWIAGLIASATVIACVVAVAEPRFAVFGITLPVLLVVLMMVIAYGQRTAMAVGSVAAVLVCFATDRELIEYVVLLLGIGMAIWRLPEIRDRRSLVGTSVWTGATLTGARLILWPVLLPVGTASLMETLGSAAVAGAAALIAGGMTLFLLPTIERVFSIATGMTLIELRDPKNELLRELQQRAPGTYNHSLNVASISEAAADAIGADSLMTYVGALYHDVGKMSKPEYFVENHSGGPNRHDKLSPAMSLLVIVGHVKDGLEMAREYRLPKPLHHFVEGHHGTTLVEYFYHRAKQQAAKDGEGAEQNHEPVKTEVVKAEPIREPDEIDYRYPGPKPRTKEVAILMLADAVESATRSIPEPTPSRIDALVRELATKRLADGQFDDCDLTFRELQTIVESISKSVSAIYHGRIKYPAGEKPEKSEKSGKPESGERIEAKPA